MRLHQFLSSVFPRLLRTKSERGRQRNAADQKVTVQKANSNSHLVLSDLKYAFDTVDPVYGQGSSALGGVTAKNGCGEPQSVRGGAGGIGTEDEMDWVSEQYEDNRIGAAVSRSRSMIRTNPWLASPKSTHNEAMQSQTGSAPAGPKSLPTTPTTSSVGKTMEYHQALARRELGLLLQVPGNVDDSSSEGYASSSFRSPSITDLDSIEGGLDSALASSVSSESDFEWGTSVTPSYSVFHAASTPGYEIVGLDCRGDAEGTNEELMDSSKTDDQNMETTSNEKGELHSKKLHHVSIQNDMKELVAERNSIEIIVPQKHPNELKLVKCYSHFELSSSELVQQYPSRKQCESPSITERIQQKEELRPSVSTKDNKTTQGDSEETKEDEEKNELQNMDRTDDRNVSSRSLSEISESLQDKVRRLHEQKLHVDAIFLRAREADRQREYQFAKFRSQFIAAKRQALVRKLQELQTMLGNQSSKLQVVYDAVLLVQWPKVFTVCEARSTNY